MAILILILGWEWRRPVLMSKHDNSILNTTIYNHSLPTVPIRYSIDTIYRLIEGCTVTIHRKLTDKWLYSRYCAVDGHSHSVILT